MVTCSVYKEGTIVEQRNAGDAITHEEEVIEGEWRDYQIRRNQ